MDDMNHPPNDVRGFVHKRLLGGAAGFFSGGPLGALTGFARAGRGNQVATAVKFGVDTTDRQREHTAHGHLLLASGQRTGLAHGGPATPPPGKCRLPAIQVGNRCVDITAAPIGGRPFVSPLTQTSGVGAPVGDAVMGRFGAALVPGSRIIDRAVCLRGMVVAVDGLCYNRSQIKNSERMWPRGRRPLLTGGDMRAIGIAARAASRLTRTAIRLHEIGLIKKPIARKLPKKK